jgi:hypothetical protein
LEISPLSYPEIGKRSLSYRTKGVSGHFVEGH